MKKISFLLVIISFLISSCQGKKEKVNILNEGFIYNQAQFPQCHASTIVETNNGLLAAWFGGTHEKNPDVCIYASSIENGHWRTPVLIADGVINDSLRYPCWNPVLFKRQNGDIILYYKIGPSPRKWWGVYKISSDEGETWSDENRIPDGLYGPIKNKPETLSDGNILYPTSVETSDKWNIYVEKSNQYLSNWKKIEINNNGFNAIQPTILFHGKNKLQMLCRSKNKKIVETWSEDNGNTWSPIEATSLVNNNSGIDAVTLSNGKQLLICNPVEKGRNKLSLFISEDGKKWKELLILEDQPKGEFSYPAIIQGKDGSIHITYTYNRVKIKYVHLELI